MDPITQGVFGAVAGQAAAKKATIAKASLVAALSGMAPDLDVLIRSSEDSLLFLEFHRHFTHSLLFIPIGGTICGLFFFLCLGKYWNIPLRLFLLWSVAGYATHALLDGCTSYGTRLLWPISSERFAWDMVSVIDPIFSAVLLSLVVAAIVFKKKVLTIGAIAWIGIYLGAAAVQHQRALTFANELAKQRGHAVQRLHAKPSFGNIIVWKIIYESNEVFYVDAYKPGIFQSAFWQGQQLQKLDVARDFPWLESDSQQAKDIERFREFSVDFLALDPNNKNRIGDVRYSQLPNDIKPLWSIELFPDADKNQHAKYVTQRDGSREALPRLFEMIVK